MNSVASVLNSEKRTQRAQRITESHRDKLQGIRIAGAGIVLALAFEIQGMGSTLTLNGSTEAWSLPQR